MRLLGRKGGEVNNSKCLHAGCEARGSGQGVSSDFRSRVASRKPDSSPSLSLSRCLSLPTRVLLKLLRLSRGLRGKQLRQKLLLAAAAAAGAGAARERRQREQQQLPVLRPFVVVCFPSSAHSCVCG